MRNGRLPLTPQSSGSESEEEDGLCQRAPGVVKIVIPIIAGCVVLFMVGNILVSSYDDKAPILNVHATQEAPSEKLPVFEDGLTSTWNGDLLHAMCHGREAGELPVFDDDDEDEGDEDFASAEDHSFHDAYEGDKANRRRLKTSMPAVDGIRRFTLRNGATMPYYSSADLQQEESSGAEFAIFVFHGAVRDAINYFCAGRKIMGKQNKYPLNRSLLIVLKWHYSCDKPLATDVWWNSSKPWGSWMAGGNSDIRSAATVSSFAIIDEFLISIADNPKKYPKLKEILLMGHSAGGQTLHRYAFATYLKPPHLSTPEDVKNRRGFRKDLDVRFVVANPSSYLYLDKHRWAYSCGDGGANSCTTMEYKPYEFMDGRRGWSVDFEYGDEGYRTTEGLGVKGKDRDFICRNTAWNHWFYGLNWHAINNGFVIPYLRSHPNLSEAVRMYPKRDVVYLVGQNDTCTDNEFSFCDAECWTRSIDTAKCYRNHMDMRCPAMLQGPNRKQRALHYQRHLLEYYGEKVHNLFVVKNTGHEGGKIVTSDYGITAIEGDYDELYNLAVDPYSIPLGQGVRAPPIGPAFAPVATTSIPPPIVSPIQPSPGVLTPDAGSTLPAASAPPMQPSALVSAPVFS